MRRMLFGISACVRIVFGKSWSERCAGDGAERAAAGDGRKYGAGGTYAGSDPICEI